ncbi:methanogenic corrinoid protein MtbC1 [Saccharothrix coeruleofusca]|uniref:cobalamin-dependent protein n=1 Tax=Saccharothrix coeruleofusca TaxID=33919 RepID=UPI001AE58D71|nr:cobalamin-dependent protein [Saccharothrix coeruleofusca]MBP2333949.1 methanogenic corrinoid protein MtbC1 [Saccharothrix coeruleofusca]
MTDREELMAALAAADERAAVAVALRLLDRGVPAETVLLDLVAEAQAEVGRRWQVNEWSVAREHAATAINERVIAAVGSRVDVPPTKGHVVVSCLDGEWHAVPPRIVAEVLRGRGWRVTFLGASVPTAHLVSYLHEHGPDAVALSCTLSRSLPRADQVVAACRATGTPVLVGGRGFGADGRWAKQLGVDSWAPTAPAAAELLEHPEWRRTAQPAPPRRADPEYAALRIRRAELIGAAVDALYERFPPMRGYDERRLDATLEDVGHIVDFLSASVYVDDVELFGEFMAWTAEVLAARGVPVASTEVAMSAMSRVLEDHPRALRHLDHGRQVVRVA